MLKELQALTPFSWDKRIICHPTGDKLNRQFAKADQVFKQLLVEKSQQDGHFLEGSHETRYFTQQHTRTQLTKDIQNRLQFDNAVDTTASHDALNSNSHLQSTLRSTFKSTLKSKLKNDRKLKGNDKGQHLQLKNGNKLNQVFIHEQNESESMIRDLLQITQVDPAENTSQKEHNDKVESRSTIQKFDSPQDGPSISDSYQSSLCHQAFQYSKDPIQNIQQDTPKLQASKYQSNIKQFIDVRQVRQGLIDQIYNQDQSSYHTNSSISIGNNSKVAASVSIQGPQYRKRKQLDTEQEDVDEYRRQLIKRKCLEVYNDLGTGSIKQKLKKLVKMLQNFED